MPRRRRTGSIGGVRKKVRKVESNAVDSPPSLKVDAIKVNQKESGELGIAVYSGSRRVTRSSASTRLSPVKEKVAFINVSDAKERECCVPSTYVVDPLEVEDFDSGKDSPTKDKENKNASVKNDGLVETDGVNHCESIQIKQEVESFSTVVDVINNIKVEELDCGVQSLIEEVRHLDPKTGVFSPSFIAEVETYINRALPEDWFCKSSEEGFNMMLLSRCKEKAIQRRIFVSIQGDVQVSVHRQPLLSTDVDQLLSGLLPLMRLSEESIHAFVDHIIKIVKKLWLFEICCGADQMNFKHLWCDDTRAVIDYNPYGEIRYSRCYRSLQCKRLLDSNRWRCKECSRVLELLRKRRPVMRNGQQVITSDLSAKRVSKKKSTLEQNSKQHDTANSPLSKEPHGFESFVSTDHSTPTACVDDQISQTISLPKNQDPLITTPPKEQAPYLNTPTNTLPNEQAPHLIPLSQERSPAPHMTTLSKNHSTLKSIAVDKRSFEISMSKGQSLPLPKIQPLEPETKKWEPPSNAQKIKSQIEKDGILVDDDLSRDLTDILKDLKLSDVQQRFIKEQIDLANIQKSFGMRWHPTLVRFALFMKSTSSEKYTATGMITLPSGRTLFNFSQVLFKIKEFQKADMDEIVNRVKAASSKPYHWYHSLIMDEIDVSNNLVFQRSNGELIGFVKLSDARTEMEHLEDYINCAKPFTLKPVVCKMLMYMIKGVSNGVKEAVALLASDNMPKQMVYHMTWDVIDTLEQFGIKVIALVLNGSPTTKDFLRLHTPVTRLQSGLVYDTINIRAQGRLLYFFMDASYLLKAIRNCFEESGAPGTNRILTKNSQPILWKTIVKLYLAAKWLCPKLNAKNVFLNDHSRKKPAYAVTVLCSAVAKDLMSRDWPNTSETVQFISKVHGFFECLHGLEEGESSSEGIPSGPYSSENDERFSKMLEFLDYLKKWKKEVYDDPNLTPEEKSKMIFSDELYREIELSVRAFIDATKFLLKEGTDSIPAHAFCVDLVGEYLQAGWFGFRFSCNSVVSQLFSKEAQVECQKL